MFFSTLAPKSGFGRGACDNDFHPIEKAMKLISVLALASLMAGVAHAQVTVTEPWVRATVPQQKATGFFVQLQSATDSKLVAVSSPLTPIVEIHEMAVQDNVMKMREVPGLDLPAGKAVELKPGGYHVMLMDLKAQVKAGDTVPLSLVFEGKDGKRQTMEVKAPVRALGTGSDKPAAGAHKH